MELTEILNEITSAINDELKTIKRFGASRITLFSGRRSPREISKSFIYQFEMVIQRSLPEGSRGKLIFQNRTVDADVISIEGQYLWLNIPTDIGDRIPQAYYETDLSFILEDLKEKYSGAINGSLHINQVGKNLLIGHVTNTVSDNLPVEYCVHYLSQEQTLAIDKIISAEIGVILGPPGTGKTRTLAGLIIECFMSGERILVCAYTNRAVDEALKAFKDAAFECIKDEFLTAYNRGKIIRKGTSTFLEKEPIIKNPDEIAENIKNELQNQLDESYRKIRELQKILIDMEILIKKILTRQHIQSEIDSLIKIIADKSTEYEKNDDKISNIEKQLFFKEKELSALREAGFISRLFSIKKIGVLEEEIKFIIKERDYTKGKQPKILRLVAEKRLKWQSLREKLIEYEELTKGAEINTVKRVIEENKQTIDILSRRISDLEKSIEEPCNYVINNAMIIFATLSRAHIDKDLGRTSFDRVIIDEASMAPLPQVFLAGFKAKKSIYIFGDNKQLAPICTSSKDTVRKWFARDIYEYDSLDSQIKENVSQLETQRRMPSELGELVSKIFYQGILNHDYNHKNEILNIFGWMGKRHVAMLDTSAQGALCNRHECGKGYSRINIVHAVISLSIFKEAAQIGIPSEKMAYITPYRAQAEFFGSLILKNRDIAEKEQTQFLPDLRWGTVHRFQGGEAELVIFDTCESPKQQPTKLTGGLLNIDGDDPEIEDSSRLHCVALSRAKSHLIILANLSWLRNQLSPKTKLIKIIESLSKMGCILPVPENHSALRIFDKFSQRNLFTFNLEDFPYILCNEANFYNLLSEDINKCTEKMYIVSPFLTQRRINLLEPNLRQLQAKNIKVTIWTKHPSDRATTGDQHQECAQILEEFGFKVLYRSGMHEKAVIIDDTIAYYGSLNVLSFRNTTETMMRVCDVAIVKALVDHLNLEEHEQKWQDLKINQTSTELIFKRLGFKDTYERLNEETFRKKLKKLRWIIAEDKGLPRQSTLWNRTIDWIIFERPENRESLLNCEEFQRNRSNIAGYENVILSLLKMIELKEPTCKKDFIYSGQSSLFDKIS